MYETKTESPRHDVPPRLTFVTHEYPPTRGGAATVVAELAGAAHAEGWPAKVLAAGEPTGNPETGVPVVRMGHRGRQDYFARHGLLRFLRKYERRPDEHFVFSDPGATRAALHASKNLVNHSGGYSIILHGSEIPLFGSRRLIGRFHRLLTKARRIHLLSQANRDLLPESVRENSDSIRVAPGAPSSWTHRKPSGQTETAKSGRLTVLTVARIHPRKGQKETLQALSRLPPHLRRQLRYRIVGPTVRVKYRKEIERLARTCDFPVEFGGTVPDEDLPEIYGAADVFALASQPAPRSIEGFGLVYLDASACGLPIVANRIGGVPEAVLAGETGLLADPNDPNDLTAAFERILENRVLRETLAKAGPTWAGRHDWRRTLRSVWRD